MNLREPFLRSSIFFLLAATAALCYAQSQIAVVCSANYQAVVAPASLASIFGVNLSAQTAKGEPDANGQLPAELAGVSVQVGGQTTQLLYVSPGQVNFVVPASTAPGTANVVLQSTAVGQTFQGTVEVRNTAPGLFALDGSGSGPGAVLNGVTFTGGPFLVETLANLGDDKRTRLAIYATGLRYAGNPFLDPSVTNVAASVTAQAKDSSGNLYTLPVEYAGAAPTYFGLDQVNVVLPPVLDGLGVLSLTLTVGSVSANAVTFTVNSLPDDALRLVGLSLDQNSVSAGSSVNGTVTMNAPARGSGFPVSISTGSNFVQTPGSVTVPAQQVSAGFTLQTSASGGGSATIVASAKDVSRSALLVVNPAGGPSLSALNLSADSVGGGASLTGTVILSGPAPLGGAVVQLSASATVVQPPSSVTIAFGQQSATFTIATTAVTSQQTVTITGSYNSSTQAARLNVMPPFAFSLSADSVTGGQTVTGTITLGSAAPVSGAIVRLATSDLSVASVPQVLTIASGQTSASFTIATTATSTARSVTITATYGSSSLAASLSVLPQGAPSLAGLSLGASSVTGGSSVLGTVTLTAAAGSVGVNVTLQSSNSLVVQLPASVTISNGQTSASFTIRTTAVVSTQTITISAGAGGVTKTATLTVK